ncbi:MAG TPA: hypothetical protein VMK12_33200 [Anaeromyxobacteraceae bacterium]|nr:hypothetical protein [Anaeromyxobacteraceae bacterium]
MHNEEQKRAKEGTVGDPQPQGAEYGEVKRLAAETADSSAARGEPAEALAGSVQTMGPGAKETVFGDEERVGERVTVAVEAMQFKTTDVEAISEVESGAQVDSMAAKAKVAGIQRTRARAPKANARAKVRGVGKAVKGAVHKTAKKKPGKTGALLKKAVRGKKAVAARTGVRRKKGSNRLTAQQGGVRKGVRKVARKTKR